MTTRSRIRLALALAIVTIVALPATALASPGAQTSTSDSNLVWLLAALIVVWAGFFAYTFFVSRKTRDMRRELDELRERLGKGERSE